MDSKGTLPQPVALIGEMLHRTRHRGPEASSHFLQDGLCLGHNRLKIIDLSDEANQPFHYQGLVLVFNGEVYNYIELRHELIQAGYQFRTASDTEVIAAAYLHWGQDCVLHFIGMWALALWDQRQQLLFCSRDRFGIKPFYYTWQNGLFAFASEMKALKCVPGFNPALNHHQLNRGLAFGWVENGDETVYQFVKNLPPAHHLLYQNGQLTVKQYWDVNFHALPKSSMSWQEKKEHFRHLFLQSVKLHSRSDVANGICLSGGLDSSAIASAFSTLYPATSIKAFNIYYTGEGKVDERPFVKAVCEKYPNIQPHYLEPTHADVAAIWQDAAYYSDVPLWGSSYLSGYFVMRLAKEQGVTVVNDGQGADEYLGGYLHGLYRIIGSHFQHLRFGQGLQLLKAVAMRENFSPKKKRDFLLKSLACVAADEEQLLRWENRQYAPLVGSRSLISLPRKTEDRFDNFLYHQLFNATLQPILLFEDRRSMMYSLESRVPFLNHQLTDFAFSLSTADRVSQQGETKHILREALRDILPQQVYARRDKKGFVTPGEVEWLNGPLAHLLQIDYSALEWLHVGRARQLVDAYRAGHRTHAKLVWKIAALHYWVQNNSR